jgi:hypothetical protein
MNMNELKAVVLDHHVNLVIRYPGDEDWIADADRLLDNTLHQIDTIADCYPHALGLDGWDDVWDRANHTLHEHVEDWVRCNARGRYWWAEIDNQFGMVGFHDAQDAINFKLRWA